jgi:uncharacterized protein
MSAEPGELAELPRSTSLELLRSAAVGRIVFTDRAMPAIAPVNFAVLSNGDVVFQTGTGSKLSAATREAVVAFEADSFDESTHDAWSVVVTGRSRIVVTAEELSEIGAALAPAWVSGDRRDVIRVSADIVEGRRLRPDRAG